MPIYMDLHIIPGVKAKDVADAHLMDVMIQDAHECKCMTYWVDESRGHVFCLIDAPAKEIVSELHNKAHGLVPHKIIEVQTSVVESFLGRIEDPADAPVTNDGLKLINDPSLRIIMVAMMHDPILLQHTLGKEKALELCKKIKDQLRKQLLVFNGTETISSGHDYIASFIVANNALSCALAVQQELTPEEKKISGFRIGLHAGEPVATRDTLFGDTILMAKRIGYITKNYCVGITSSVNELLSKEFIEFENDITLVLSNADEQLLSAIMNTLEQNWQDPLFDSHSYSQAMAMSQSQLYRKTVSLTGLTPHELITSYKLEKAKELLRKNNQNISQVTFETGFSSPSYFTKCFKRKYGILPLAYMEMAS